MGIWKKNDSVWIVPRIGDVVIDDNGVCGIISSMNENSLERKLNVNDEFGIEIHSNESMDLFMKADTKKTKEFYDLMLKNEGYYVGNLCSYKNIDVPLEITDVFFNVIGYRIILKLKDLREYDGDILECNDKNDIIPFTEKYPSLDNMLNDSMSGLRYRLEIFLHEKENVEGWTNCGSVWEFFDEQDAMNEVKRIESQLKIRRVSSVMCSGWKIKFPCWTIEVSIDDDGNEKTRVTKVYSGLIHSGYFDTAVHASYALKILGSKVFLNACGFSQDGPIV